MYNNQSISIIFGLNLNKLRKEKKIKQCELAEKAGISKTAICALESGAKWPRKKTIESLAQLLSVEPIDFFKK